MSQIQVPFFRPNIGDAEVAEVVDTLRSGWLTTGPKVRRFEADFAAAVGAPYAVAVNSCTSALHLAVEALGSGPGQAVLVPTMTFAATAEVVRYQGAVPILVDCDPATGNMDLDDAARKCEQLRSGRLTPALPHNLSVVGMMPTHVGGMMMDMKAVQRFADEYGLWSVEDAAHAFPAAWRRDATGPWQRCGEQTAAVTCFSFYANKTITTGEGGMATTHDAHLAERMRIMSLHGLSQDAWKRYSGGNWDYRILAPGFKYNLTDIAAAIGVQQLQRAETMRQEREAIAAQYRNALAELEQIELPLEDSNRINAWHLFPIRLQLKRLTINRNAFMEEMKTNGVNCSVHWRPLHLHPYYQETFGWEPNDFPVASTLWRSLISLPIFPGMREEEIKHVIGTVRATCRCHARKTMIPKIGA